MADGDNKFYKRASIIIVGTTSMYMYKSIHTCVLIIFQQSTKQHTFYKSFQFQTTCKHHSEDYDANAVTESHNVVHLQDLA